MTPEHKFYFFMLISAVYLSRTTPKLVCWVVGVVSVVFGFFVRDGV